MNRQIKFRAKRLDNGEWLYGDILRLKDGTCFISSPDAKIGFDRAIVKPSTVGQFTGLQDCNGNDIYEGDILKMCHPDKCRCLTYEVYWRTDCAAWYVRDEHYNDPLVSALGYCKHKIVGNVFDTPDLLKGDE